MRYETSLTSMVFATVLTIASSPVLACAYDGLLGHGLKAAHPQSIRVAIAVRDSIDDGILPEDGMSASAVGKAGYWNALRRLHAFRTSLQEVSTATPPISILLIDSGLWVRLTPEKAGLSIEPHLSGPTQGDVIIVTSDAVLAGVQSERVTMAEAMSRGMLVIDGETPREQAVARLVAHVSVTGSRSYHAADWLFGSPEATVREPESDE